MPSNRRRRWPPARGAVSRLPMVVPHGTIRPDVVLPGTRRWPVPNEVAHLRVAVVGGGFGGLGTAIRLRQEGVHDFLVFERSADVGGTWRDNTYPGCACDVPSHLYSFSFAPNPRWTRSFSAQPEIWNYLRDCA